MPARKLLSGFLTAVLFTALPAAAKDIVWKQQTITITKNPSRIAVYDPAALDILESLGVQTAAYNDGGQLDPAKLAAEPPELIILGGATAGRLKDTAAIAPSLDLTPDTDSYLTDLAARTMLLADIFGKNKAAEQKLKAVSNKRAILKQRTEGKTAEQQVFQTELCRNAVCRTQTFEEQSHESTTGKDTKHRAPRSNACPEQESCA